MAWSRKTAFAWTLSVITLALSAAASDESGLSTKLSSLDSLSLEPFSTSKADEALSEKPLQHTTNVCDTNADCRNGGRCWNDLYRVTYCNCMRGTSGVFCEVVDECARNTTMCGNGKDVQCGYDLETQKAMCKCNNASKGFDTYVNKCRVPCTYREYCVSMTRCIKNRGDDLYFCKCRWGMRGDRCAKEVDECKEIGLDCGTNPNVTCLEGEKGQPVCYCKVGDWSEAYDYEAKDCKKCDCGESHLGCRFFPNGTKLCYCDSEYYQKDGICEACGCGSGSDGCKYENGTKRCNCLETYLDNRGICEMCDCGSNQNGCSFKNGQKSCDCKPGYIQANGTCRKDCTASDVECKHGGKCEDRVCQCLPGTNGDVCEFIEGCKDSWEQNMKCGYSGDAYCDFNETSLKSYCRCKHTSFSYDPYYRVCKACDCGPDGSCSFVDGQRTCACKKGYAEKPASWYSTESKCHPCNCGQRSAGCTFIDSYTKQCHCEKGYSQKDGECSVCNCGQRSLRCTFLDSYTKQCYCELGYKEKDGECSECVCGNNGNCEFNDEGEKTCNCIEGYGDDDGICADCGCWLNYSTTINCIFTNGVQKCLCPKGYIDDSLVCRDINECLNRSACPENTKCENTEGNYTCTCEDGFRPRSDHQDPKRYGCIDINECVENNVCRYNATTECVNTVNGYYCRCKDGYSGPFLQISIGMEGCVKDQTGWKTGYIVLASVVLLLILLLLLIVIIKKRSFFLNCEFWRLNSDSTGNSS